MDSAAIQRVLVVGGGESGSQIALQFARFGIHASVLDLSQDQLESCRRRQKDVLDTLVSHAIVQDEDRGPILGRITFSDDAVALCRDADLVCECVTEDLDVKRTLLRQLDSLCPNETIFTTNTSYLVPSQLARASGRPDRLAALHFHMPVWFANAADIMPHRGTAPEVVDTLQSLARRIGQVPIVSRRENPGYVFNTMLYPLLMYAMDLLARDVADFEDIDRSWMAVTKMPIGPFGMIDTIGLDTVYAILKHWSAMPGFTQAKRVVALLEPRVAQQQLGRKAGVGFYRYPHPAFESAGFLGHDSGSLAKEAAAATPSPCHSRLIPVWQPAPIHPSIRHHVRLSGSVAVVGSHPLAARLARELELTGAKVRLFTGQDASVEAWMESQLANGPLPHLCLVGLDATLAGVDSNREQFEATCGRQFRLTRIWYAALKEKCRFDAASLMVVTSRCGPGNQPEAMEPAAAAMRGLAKAVSMESMAAGQPGIATRFIELCEADLDSQVERVLGEWAVAQAAIVTGDLNECRRRQANVEVRISDHSRDVVRYRTCPPETVHANAPRGSWLVSGGASGIGLESAIALAKRFGLSLHLLGRTALPDDDYEFWSDEQISQHKSEVMRKAYRNGVKPNEAWAPIAKTISLKKNLHKARSEGVRFQYHVCDVSDRLAVRKLVEGLGVSGEAVRGVLHAAGVEFTCRFEAKTDELFRATTYPKVLGAHALIEATSDQPLEWFIGYGSLVGSFGGIGQVDYAMGNDAMTSILLQASQRRTDCRFVSFHWPGWKDTGMMARNMSDKMLAQLQHEPISIEDGVACLMREIDAGGPNASVVVTRICELGDDFLVPS